MKCAVVGCGQIGRQHARVLAALPGVELVAHVDPRDEPAASFAQSFGSQGFGNLGELLDSPVGRSLDFVSIATPPTAHYEQAMCCLKSGLAVFVEKPLAMTAAEAVELQEFSAKRGLPVGIGFKMRFEPVFRKAKELVAEIGQIDRVSTFKLQPYRPKPGFDWVPMAGAMIELSVHEFDLVHWICDLVPVRVMAKLDYSWGWQRENSFAAIVEYEGGVVGSLSGGYARSATFQCRDLTIMVGGERGYIRIERPDRIVVHTDEFRIYPVDPAGDAFYDELSAFVDALKSGETPPVSAADGALATRLIDACVRSDRLGAAVPV